MPGMDAIVSIGFEGGLQDEWASKRGLQEGSGAAPRDQSAEGEAIVSETQTQGALSQSGPSALLVRSREQCTRVASTDV